MDYSDDEWVTSSEVIESSRRSAPSVATKAGDKRTDQAAEYITPEELDKYCRAMDSAGLVQRLATVYKNAEAYLKIREIETSKLTIEVRLCEQLHDCPDPGVFILGVIRQLSKYFDQPIKSKSNTLTPKFRRYLAQAACRALELFFNTPPKDYKRPTPKEEEKDLISFADADEEEPNLISFDDDVSPPNGVLNEEEGEETTTTEEDDEDEEEGEIVASISLMQLLNIPPEVAQRYQLRRDHQLECIRLLDDIEAPILVYYAMDVYNLEPLLRRGGEFENDGAKFCRMLLKHAHYNEAISCIRKLDLFHAFPLEQFANELFNAGQEKITAVYVSGKEQLQRQLLRYINLQLRFTFAGKLGIVSPENLEISEEDAQVQPLPRLRDRKFQKDLTATASKVIQELNIPDREYYFIWLSQRYACLRWIIMERGSQQNEERDLSIAGTSNYNGLIDLVAGEDPALAKLAIKEFVDMGDPYAPAYFATRLGQQEFFVFYSSRPSQERVIGVIKGESLTRHRSCISPRKSSPYPQPVYYSLPYYAQPIMVDNQDMVLQMQYVLNQCQICGLDSEWVPQFARSTNSRTSLLQIAIDNGTIFLVDIKTAFDPSNAALLHLMDKTLQQLFEAEHIVKLAYDFDGDFSMLKSCMPTAKKWKLNNLVDFKNIRVSSTNKNGKNSGTTAPRGLSGVVSTFLGVSINKKQQISNWDQRPLTMEQANYAAGDAYCLLQVYAVLQQEQHPFLSTLKNAPEIHLNGPSTQPSNYQYSTTPPPPYVDGTTYYSSYSPYHPNGMPQF